MILPPPGLRQGGQHFQTDEAFLASATHDAERLRSWRCLTGDSRVVDFGCGAGRFAYGLLNSGWFHGSYLGIEVQKRHVDWGTTHITAHHPEYRFVHFDARNERYNPGGATTSELPVEAGVVDLFYAYSVFTHMRGYDVEAYLRQVAQMLSPRGRAFVTVFAAEDVPDEIENPADYGPFKWDGPLHCVLYSTQRVKAMADQGGLRIARWLPDEYDGQTGLILRAVRSRRWLRRRCQHG